MEEERSSRNEDFQVSGLDNQGDDGTRNGETGCRSMETSRCAQTRLGSNSMWDTKVVKSRGQWIFESIPSSGLEV